MSETKHILEIGPGAWSPLHNRDIGRLTLEDDEDYIGLEIDSSNFKSAFWERVKRDYNDKVSLIQGDAHNLPFEDASLDEVVALGVIADEDQLMEVDRVLKPGGIVVLGTMIDNEALFFESAGIILREKGYTFLNQEVKKYNYKDVVKDRVDKMVEAGDINTQEALDILSNNKNIDAVIFSFVKPE